MDNASIKKLEADLWESADLLRAGSKLTSNQYCMPVLGLLFLRYAYSRYKMVEEKILKDRPVRNGRKMPVEASDFTAKSALFLPEMAQFDYLVNLPENVASLGLLNVSGQTMGSLSEVVNNAMELVEQQSDQLHRDSDMTLSITPTKTHAGTRKLPITDDVAEMFKAIIHDRPKPKVEKMVDGYSGLLFLDDNDLPLVAMHWEYRFNHMVHRYNEIYKLQMPNVTPHICRHTYCTNMAKSGMNPKTLQYLMGHSDIGVTMNVYTHLGLDDAKDEMIRMEELEQAKKEVQGEKNETSVSQKMFKVI
ncbi:tyrosine-type recombinase/integrase [Bacteroides heparinolyticus]|uniref:tyrosine-type recombinase/integrase n=1 Tax=Prevotella heparinolytica TaxID=28113 RepID=UPI0035A0EC3B